MTDELVWVPISVIAKEYGKSPRMIRKWVHSGFILEIGYFVRRDITGHFIIGVPRKNFGNFGTNPVVNQTQSL